MTYHIYSQNQRYIFIMTKYLFMANSAYSLYQYSLLFPNRIDKTLFVVGPALHKANVLNKIKFNVIDDIKEAKIYEKALLRAIDIALNGNQPMSFVNLSTPYTSDIPIRYPVCALSDGLSDLTLFPKYLQDKRIKHCFGTQINALKETHMKLKTINLKQAWQSLNPEHQTKIAHIFGVSEADLNNLKKREVILVTQPLSEDGIISEDDKIKLYRNIASNYNIDKLIIKPHPRENTNWKTIFPNVPIITSQVPAELLSDIVHIEKVATFFSTAAFGMTEEKNVDIYSKDFSKLFFSDPNKKMGRMPYVDIEKAYSHRPFNWRKLENYFYNRQRD